MGQHVFICYASKDKAQATSVSELLERYGIACWMAHRNIPPGVTWATAIADAIDTANLLLVLISSSANTSRHVAREIERADRKQIPIVPLRIENITPSKNIEYFINNVQWIDIFQDSIDSYWPQLSLAIGQNLHQLNFTGEDGSALQIQTKSSTSNAVYNASGDGQKEERTSFGGKLTRKKIAGILTAIGVVLGAAAGAVSGAKSVRDGICSWGSYWFCEEQIAMRRLQKVGFNETELYKFANNQELPPKVRNEAQRKRDVIDSEKKSYEKVKDDIGGLKEFLAKPCEACLVKPAAEAQLNRLIEALAAAMQTEQDENKALQKAGYVDEPMLERLASSAKTEKVRHEAQRILQVIESEKNKYEANKNDIGGLERLLASCEACLVKHAAEAQLKKLEEDRTAKQLEQDERGALQSAGFLDITMLKQLASNAKTREVRDKAHDRLDVIDREKSNYELVKNDIEDLSKFLSKRCEACLVKPAAEAQLKKLKEAETAKQIEQDEQGTLKRAGFVGVTVLRQLASGANTQEVRDQAQHRLNAIDGENMNYQAVKNDIQDLTAFLSKPCEACLVNDIAESQLKKLKEAQTAKQNQLSKLQKEQSIQKAKSDASNPRKLEKEERTSEETSDKCPVDTTAHKQLARGAVVGYAILMEFEKDHQTLRKHWFETTAGNPGFPAAGETIISTPSDNVSSCLRDGPFHSGDVDPSRPIALIQKGQKVRMGGDVLLSTDPNGLQYAVAPISEIVGAGLRKNYRLFKPRTEPGKTGFVNVGVISKEILGEKGPAKYRSKMQYFENVTRRGATFPAPKDRLVAMKDAILYSEHRLYAKQKGTIKKGQRVTVAGDTILTDGGVYVWSPILMDGPATP